MKIFLLGLSLFLAAMTLPAVASELRSIASTDTRGYDIAPVKGQLVSRKLSITTQALSLSYA